jgi:acetyl esterase/lipase
MNLILICTIALALAAVEIPSTRASGGTLKDVVYRTVGGVDLKLDIHRPNTPQGPDSRPVVIYVHGGGWMTGDKSGDFKFDPFSDAGLVVVSISYRLAPDHVWPACRDDVAAAVEWVKKNAADYGIDPDRLAIMGYSAGGHLAMDAATRVPGIRAAVGIAAPTDLVLDNYRRGGPSKSMQALFGLPADKEGLTVAAADVLYDNSPINHITKDHPPTLLVAGDTDTSVPHHQSTHYQKRLESVGVRCELITMPAAGHRLREYADDWEQRVAGWLAKEFGVNE